MEVSYKFSRFALDLAAMYQRISALDASKWIGVARKTANCPVVHSREHNVRHVPLCRQCVERKLDSAQHVIECFDLTCEVLACRCIQDGRLVDDAVPELPPGVLFELFLRKRGAPTEQSTAHFLVSLPTLTSRTLKMPLTTPTFEVPSNDAFFEEHEEAGVRVLAWHLAHTTTESLKEVQMRMSNVRALISMMSVPVVARKWHLRVARAYQLAQSMRTRGIVPHDDLRDAVMVNDMGDACDYRLFTIPALTEERKTWALSTESSVAPTIMVAPVAASAPAVAMESGFLQLARVAETIPPLTPESSSSCDVMTRKRGRGASQSTSA